MLALALLLLSLPSDAATVSLGPGPKRKPLFVQLYRQSVYAAARYGRGADAYDQDLSPGATAELTVSFTDEGEVLRVALSGPEGELVSSTAAFPRDEWDLPAEIESARRLAGSIASRIPGTPAAAGAITTDLARARLAYRSFDWTSMVWLTNALGEAQRGRVGSVESLKLLSAAHGWTGRWLEALPTPWSKLFQARALAYAALARAVPELALALAQCGRSGDALFALTRSTPDASEAAEVALALARRDSATARARAEGSRQWRWTLALASEYPGMGEESQATLRVLASSSPADAPALHYWALGADVNDGHSATEAYVALPFLLQRGGRFLEGRRVVSSEEDSGGDTDYQALLAALRGAGQGDPSEEVPRGARAALLLDAAVDSAVLRQRFLVHYLGSPQSGEAFAREAAPLAAHPWGFMIPLIRDDLDRLPQPDAALRAGLEKAPFAVGGVMHAASLFLSIPGFHISEWLSARENEFDDVARDAKTRALAAGSAEAMKRLAQLEPYDSGPYERREDAILDEGLARLGERPGLLGYKLRNALEKRPRSAPEISAAAERLLKVSPKDHEAIETKAALLLYGGQPLEAAETWRRAVASQPGTLAAAQAAARMAWAYSVAGQTRRARRIALAAAPAYSYMNLAALARTLEDTGRFDLEEQVYAALQARYERAARRNLLGRFYLRTGDPRGHGLVHAAIPRFFKHQTEPGAVLTDEEHLDLLHAFLLTEEWGNAFELLNTVIIPRWHDDEARYRLWLFVTGLRSEQAGYTALAKALMDHRKEMSEKDPFMPVIDAFLQLKTPEQAAAELDLDPDDRTLGLYMLAQYWVHVRADPAKAGALLEAAVALKRYDETAYYLALKALGRVPSYPQRLRRQLLGILADIALAPGRVRRWLMEDHVSSR